MSDINRAVLVGRLTRDAEVKYTAGGTACAKVSVAVNRSRKGADGKWGEEVSYLDVTIWGKPAESLKPYLLKGKQIAVDGYLKQDRWEKDGKTNSRVGIVADNVQLLGGNGGQTPQGGFAPQNYAGYADAGNGGFPEDIPF